MKTTSIDKAYLYFLEIIERAYYSKVTVTDMLDTLDPAMNILIETQELLTKEHYEKLRIFHRSKYDEVPLLLALYINLSESSTIDDRIPEKLRVWKFVTSLFLKFGVEADLFIVNEVEFYGAQIHVRSVLQSLLNEAVADAKREIVTRISACRRSFYFQ